MAKAKEIFNDLNLVLRLNQHIEEITSNEASAASLLTQETSFQILTELSSLSNPDPREDAQFDHQRAAFRSTDGSNLPFHLQGDQAFNEASALARRRQLRHCEAIKDKVRFLWQVARGRKSAELAHATSSERIRRLSGSAASTLHPPVSSANSTTMATINEHEYSEMMLLIFKVLRDDFVLETAQLQIQCDWEVDSHHGAALSYDQFFPALFELVDVWTCDILENTYVRFLELLARRITVRVVVFLDDMQLKLALSDNFDEAVVVKAIPLSTIKKFAPMAKVLEGTGVRTVGELARADPKVVETQRVGYLQKNAFSHDKIGGDLQHLLDMFRELSQQFDGASYSLQDKALRRHSRPQNQHQHLQQHEQQQYQSTTGARGGDNVGDLASQIRRGSGGQADAHRSKVDTGVASDDGDRRPSGATAARHSVAGSDPRLGGRRHASEAQGHVVGEYEGIAGSFSDPSSRDGATSSYPSTSGSLLDDATSAVDPLLRRGIKRINTFHDISVTETGVIDALKSSFLIEKGISIQRKTSLASIQAELAKFGVDTKAMSDAAMEEKYDSLYEMFVLRDGENIQALAQSILARIKMELAAHGIVVSDDEAEAMYDGFYGSVVAGSGERIVADAKSWVDDTISTNSYGAYVKQDYHELKSIDEVKRLGSGDDDAEFMSLLSTEDDEEEESDDNANGGDKQSEHGDVVGKAAESPTSKASSSLSRRPSLYRGLSDRPKKDKELGERSSRSLALTESNNAEESDAAELSGGVMSSKRSAGEEDSMTSAAQPHESPVRNGQVMDPNGERDHQQQSDCEDVLRTQENDVLCELVTSTDTDSDAEGCGVEKRTATPEDTSQQSVKETDTLSGDRTTHTEEDDDDPTRRTTICTPQPLRVKTDAGDEAFGDSDGNHSHLNESDRAPQGVGYGYDDGTEPVVVEARARTPESPATREPKVPDIVVSGVDNGRHISVAARYIQLLGLGNVTTIIPESSLMELLTSPAKAGMDLLCFDVGRDLDTTLAKATQLVSLVGRRRVILFGGDEQQPERSGVVARLCVSEAGVLYFATVPMDFTTLRGEISSFFEASPHLFVLRARRPTAMFGAAAKLLSNSIRATNMISVEDDHPRSVMTPPLHVDNSGAKAIKRKATATSIASLATPPSSSLPHVVAPKREVFSPFRPLRVVDEMPGADMALTKRLAPVVPNGYASKATRSSPRISAALKKLMR